MKLLIAFVCLTLNLVPVWANPIAVNIVWGFSPNNSITNYTRHIIHQANLDQNKYVFNLEVKSGAAGLIAAKQVLADTNNKKVSILMTTDAFFVRPYLFANPGYTFDEFDLLYQFAQVPMALVMKKERKFEDLLQQKSLTLSIIGPGSFTHVMAQQFSDGHSKDTVLVAYPGPREAVKDVVGGDLDLAFDFVSSVVGDPKLEIVGITGSQSSSGLKRISDINKKYYSFNNLNLGVYYLMSRQAPTDTMNEIKNILLQAQIKSKPLQQSMKNDYATLGETDEKFYQERIKQIARLTSGMAKVD